MPYLPGASTRLGSSAPLTALVTAASPGSRLIARSCQSVGVRTDGVAEFVVSGDQRGVALVHPAAFDRVGAVEHHDVQGAGGARSADELHAPLEAEAGEDVQRHPLLLGGDLADHRGGREEPGGSAARTPVEQANSASVGSPLKVSRWMASTGFAATCSCGR